VIIYQQVKNLNIYLSKPLFINDLQKFSTALPLVTSHYYLVQCEFAKFLMAT
tara:strand:- start:49 stop:204 length:156 start_codon:yes stop_codon:yes gene_type:complete